MKRLKPYIYTSLSVIGILAVVFFIKGIYPFGNNSLIWGDMHDQITAFYYHIYDTFHSNKSLLVDFTTSGGINFLGILAYYVLSPISLIVLLVPRSDIYLVVSIIVALKILIASLTCLYFLRTFYKNMPSILYIILSLIYAFSGYSLMFYQITPWMDAVYMLPLIMIGLKKVLDLEKPTFYIITLALSMIFSFYVTIMTIIFIFLISLIYLLVYKTKEARKKAITSLGVSTVFSLLISAFIVVPSYLQISVSSRLGFNLFSILNSKTGPITDKIGMMMFGGLAYVGILLLLKDYKKNKQFLKFYIPAMILLFIPVIIEPVNKILHFGSYACFPYRFGFFTALFIVLGAAHYFNNFKFEKVNEYKFSKVLSIIITICVCIVMGALSYKYHSNFQDSIYRLSLSFDRKCIYVTTVIFISTVLSCLGILLLNKKNIKFSLSLIAIITVSNILVNGYTYLGIDKIQKEAMHQYIVLNAINKDYKDKDYFRIKNYIDIPMNNGMVTKFSTLDHFTSLTEKNNLEALKKLGYASTWVKTHSKGSNLIIDKVLANKYLITEQELNNPYYELVNTYDEVNFYKLKENISYGVMLNHNDTIFDKKDAFEISNSLYQNILNTNDKVFETVDDFELINIKTTSEDEEGFLNYEIIDSNYDSYFEKNITVTDKQNIYLEILQSLDNSKNRDISYAFNLYVNDELYMKNVYLEPENGIIDLGIHENETLNIKLEMTRGVKIKGISIGIMDIEKYENFVKISNIDSAVEYNKNKINITVNNGIKDKILLIPMTYSENYTATNNRNKVDIVKVYDNYIGIKLETGVNNIKLTYTPTGIIPFTIISLLTIVATTILLKTKMYDIMIGNKMINNLAYYIYILLYIALIFIVYLFATLCFIISYFTVIRI